MKKTMKKGIFLLVLALIVAGGVFALMTACSGGGGSGGGQKMTGPNDAFNFTLVDGGKAYSVSAGTAVEGTVNIPSHYRPNADSNYLPVTIIHSNAFKDKYKNITQINIPSTVTELGSNAFHRCTSLTSVTLPKGLTTIKNEAFGYCTGLTSITIPASVEYLDCWVFREWTASQTINIQGKANREATIAAGWDSEWDKICKAQIVYGK
jgi:hypothetical protein